MKVLLFPSFHSELVAAGHEDQENKHKRQKELPLVTLSSADEWLQLSGFLMKHFWASGQGNLSQKGTERWAGRAPCAPECRGGVWDQQGCANPGKWVWNSSNSPGRWEGQWGAAPRGGWNTSEHSSLTPPAPPGPWKCPPGKINSHTAL